MTYTTLLTTEHLAAQLHDPAWVCIDARFTLADSERGRRDYAIAHLPHARYLHLNTDLSGPVTPGVTGRHPLPRVDALTATFAACGIDAQTQVVVYDDAGGALAAARVWWLLRWLGHDAVAVLDGGWQKWLAENRPTSAELPTPAPRVFVPHVRSGWWVSSVEILSQLTDPRFKLFDSRAADRYRGENEIIDPVAGHIPGAISAPYADNLNPDGTFKAITQLRARFEALVDHTPAENTAFYCGSGVTAAHNILALKHAGLGDAQLYAGSWSEWITDSSRPIKIGQE